MNFEAFGYLVFTSLVFSYLDTAKIVCVVFVSEINYLPGQLIKVYCIFGAGSQWSCVKRTF